MKRIKLFFGAAAVIAMASAFATKETSAPSFITLWKGAASPAPCNSTPVCSLSSGVSCTDFFSDASCTNHYNGSLKRANP